MPKRISQEIEERAVSLYANNNLSIAKTQMCLAAEGVKVGTNWIRRVVIKRGLERSIKNAQTLAMNTRRIPLQCQACDRSFDGKQVNEKFCSTCSPTPQARRRLKNYGLNEPEFQHLLTQQNHACATCKKPFAQMKVPQKRTSPIVVDHSHVTGTVRGLLCHECNITVGYIEKHSRDILENILVYLATEEGSSCIER